MREWSKETFKSERGKLLIVLVVLLTIGNYFILSITLSLMLVSLIVILLFSNLYNKYATVQLGNSRKVVRLFPSESATIPFQVEGKSIVPLYYGKLSFQMNNVIILENSKHFTERRETTDYYYDVSSHNKEYEFTLKAISRGRAVLRQLEIQMFDPLFLGSTSFMYRPFYKTEILVLPEMKVVKGVEKLLSREVGTKPTTYSYFQDPLLISGVRDYAPGDAFGQIHWKASSRTGVLQTKILEKTTHQKWTFLLNILEEERGSGPNLSISRNLESRLSHIAYLIQMAEKQGASFELYVNILARNDLQLLHLTEGSGREHLINGLELLARIDQMSSTMKVGNFIKKIDPKLRQSSSVILCGISKQKIMDAVPNLYVQGLPLFELNSSEQGGVLRLC